MKKVLCVLFASLMLFAISGCEGNGKCCSTGDSCCTASCPPGCDKPCCAK